MKRLEAFPRLLVAVGALMLGACGGGGGGGPSKVDLTLAGAVIAPNAGDATVTVTVGTESFETKTDDSGRYSIAVQVDASQADALVTLFTKLGGDDAFVELLSNAGSFSTLQSAAGDDGVVTAAEALDTNISVLSTAEAVLIEEAASGGKGLTFGAGVDPDEALTLGAALRLAVANADEFPLPSGVETTLELARSQSRREGFIEAVQSSAPERLEGARVDLLGDPDVVGAAQPERLPAELIAARLRVGREYPFNFSGLVSGFEFEPDFTGRFFSNRSTVGTTWEIDGTRVRVHFDEPVVSSSFDPVDCDGDGFAEQRESQFSQSGVEVVLLSPVAVSLTANVTVTTPNCASRPGSRVETRTIAGTVLSDANLQPLSASQVADASFVVPVFAGLGAAAFSELPAEILSFGPDGTGSGRFLFGSFTWSASNGAIVVNWGNISGRYRRVEDIDGIASVVLADFSSPDGRFADLDLSFEYDPAQVALTAAQVPGRYFQFGVGAENGGDARLQGFRLRLDADGTGKQEDDFINANNEVEVLEAKNSIRWTLDIGELALRRYYDPGTPDGADCDPDLKPCIEFDERLITPANRNGERFYWLERRRIDNGGVDGSDPQTFIARFYDRVPLPAAKSDGRRILAMAPALVQGATLE